jgi:hypothetical protein
MSKQGTATVKARIEAKQRGGVRPKTQLSTIEHRQVTQMHKKTIVAADDESSPTFPPVALWDYPAPRCRCTDTSYCTACRTYDKRRMGKTNQPRKHPAARRRKIR